MKNKLLFTLFFSLVFLASNAQYNRGIYTNGRSTVSPVASSSIDAETMIQQIIDVVGLKPNFEVRAANVGNAAAVIYGGKRFILYSPTFINTLVQKTGNKWAAVSVLAHEIGHHLNGHTINQIGSQPETELEADEFSGFVLRKMGASLQDAQIAMKTAASEKGDYTHPGQYDRLVAIANGWNKAESQITGRDIARIQTPAPVQQQPVVRYPQSSDTRSVAQNNIDQRTIIGKLRFNADAYSDYYITSRLNVVKVANNQVSVIGKLAMLNDNRFPFMIYDNSNTQLLIDRNGTILNKRGIAVGQLSTRG